ncbi:DNA-binding transcriptional LysR family regulator [Allocatelliglobosispora scoriae]|uniref:DNA-binding transcriptional LysR family regulator n=1 Tax=Allocatelliglobosispora scoriae TaxID=643052 RepID=A0A841BMW6_9ACTN|nr:LysR family transcriptional regulator [Allocatelliglobosispora scoriae]MBB5869015.1 DNA-binding transcriptional LysR family regulator [Allocatelliglobosispora scoriae]
MNVELRHLRCLVALADAGSFTDAAAELGISQAGVSRTVAGLEAALGVLLVRRTTRAVSLTTAGTRVLGHARRVLAGLDLLVQAAQLGLGEIRVGYAWAALGEHTVPLQRRWAQRHPETKLVLVRTNSPTSGLAEGACDVAVLRVPPDDRRFASAVVGLERRFSAIATDDPWARRRAIRLSELAERTVVIDRRTGSTTLSLWPEDAQPRKVMHTGDIDDWLAVIAAGEAIGVTAESTAAQYPRPGVRYRPIPGTPPIPVVAAWWREDPHPALNALVELMADLYRTPPDHAVQPPRKPQPL